MSRNRDVKRVLDSALSVAELVEILSGMDQDAKVVFVCNYGDYSRTQQALPLRNVEQVLSCDFEDSAYSQSQVAYREADEEDWDEDEEEENEDGPTCDDCVIKIEM